MSALASHKALEKFRLTNFQEKLDYHINNFAPSFKKKIFLC